MKMIAIANHKGGVYDFFRIERFNGQERGNYDYVFDWHKKKCELERIKMILKETKKAYFQDMEMLRKSRIRVAYESTMRQRMLYRSMQKTINDAHNNRTVGF